MVTEILTSSTLIILAESRQHSREMLAPFSEFGQVINSDMSGKSNKNLSHFCHLSPTESYEVNKGNKTVKMNAHQVHFDA